MPHLPQSDANPSLEPTRSGKAHSLPRANYHAGPAGQWAALPTRSAQLKPGLMMLRSGTANDAEAIAELIASFRRELTDHPDGAGAEQYLASVSIQAEREYLKSPRYSYLVAEGEGTMQGFIALRDVSHVFHLFVARQYQRTGLARHLWQKARAQALLASAPSQFTVNSSLLAVAVYRAFGFEPAGEVVSIHGISFMPMRLKVLENKA